MFFISSGNIFTEGMPKYHFVITKDLNLVKWENQFYLSFIKGDQKYDEISLSSWYRFLVCLLLTFY